MVFPRKTASPWCYVRAVHRLRTSLYDLAIDPIPDSLSGRIALRVCRARYRLGYDSPTQWAPLTHRTPEPADLRSSHEALRPAFLLTRVFRAPWRPAEQRLWVPLPEQAAVL